MVWGVVSDPQKWPFLGSFLTPFGGQKWPFSPDKGGQKWGQKVDPGVIDHPEKWSKTQKRANLHHFFEKRDFWCFLVFRELLAQKVCPNPVINFSVFRGTTRVFPFLTKIEVLSCFFTFCDQLVTFFDLNPWFGGWFWTPFWGHFWTPSGSKNGLNPPLRVAKSGSQKWSKKGSFLITRNTRN